MKKAMLFCIFAVILLCKTSVFGNTEISEWAYEEVNEAIRIGIADGDMQGDYQKEITRAEFAKISVLFVAHKYGMDFEDAMEHFLDTHTDGMGNKLQFKENSFTDISGTKYEEYIKWANTLGITEGRGNGIFAPDSPITREEAAKMLLGVYFSYGSGVKLSEKSGEVENFSDADEISEWADTAVRYMYEWDVMVGVSKERYAPKEYYTKEQCLATFMRLNKIYN